MAALTWYFHAGQVSDLGYPPYVEIDVPTAISVETCAYWAADTQVLAEHQRRPLVLAYLPDALHCRVLEPVELPHYPRAEIIYRAEP
jgi:hypothetical protein